MTDLLNYPARMRRALQSMIAEILGDVAENGLPGDHHFYITFDTRHPAVDIPAYLKERFPETMTIVLEAWFDDLGVMDDRFCVTLNFNNTPEPLVIPFDALISFADPSIEFGLRFDMDDVEDNDSDDIVEPLPERAPAMSQKPDETSDAPDAPKDNVVTFSQFKKD